MNIIISTAIVSKIKAAENGDELLERLITIVNRSNTELHRGVVHGYLLALSTMGIIDDDEGLDILSQMYE